MGSQPVSVRGSVADGMLKVEVPERGAGATSFAEILLAVLALARRLVAPRDIALRLATNLLNDPEPGFRLNALVTLAREYPKHPATRRALLAARKDMSAEVRLRAAMALGEKGRETLLALVADEATNDACAARAIAALGEGLSSEEAAKALRRALDVGHAETAIACLAILGIRGAGASEDALLAALLCPLDDVRIAAARALGRSGTVAAVPELLRASEGESAELSHAARQAIAEIQSRLSGAAPGQLSLAGGEAGALSLAEDVAGGLSLVERDEPAVTSPPAAPRARERE